MNTKRWKRLGFVIVLLFCVVTVVALVLFALKQNINLFYTPSQIAKQEAPYGPMIRVGGFVKKGSIVRGNDLRLSFYVMDSDSEVQVEYRGMLPDLFKEGQGVVALGVLKEGSVLMAEEILAKHDENYRPPELLVNSN